MRGGRVLNKTVIPAAFGPIFFCDGCIYIESISVELELSVVFQHAFAAQ